MSLEGIGSGFLNATVAPDTTMINSTMDWIMSKMDQFPIKMSFLFACSMVIGSVVPYIPQYFTIKQTQNTEGFSLYVCLTLLVANILRIMFWFGKRFETALLVQSIVMIFAMFALLELCVRVRNSNLIIQGRRHYFADFDFRYFWEWTDFISYLECMAIFAFFTGLVMFFFINEPLVVESYGFVALVTESLLASPQFYRNYKSKSTEGMSRMMVFTWFLGDLYKTIYFVTRSAPFQFLLCGFTQITFDCLIFLQILYYKKVNYRMLSKSRTKHLEENARKMREKKMMSLINSMDPGEEDGEPIPGTSGGSAAAAAIIVEHGHCNPLDDTLVAQMHPVQPSNSSSNICSVRVIRESHNNNSNRSHRKNKNKAGKKASVELLPIGSGSGSGGTEGDDGGYVNELALVDSERQQSIDELIPVHQEAYRMEGDEEDEEEEEELAVDSDDSSQCDLQPNTSARRKL